MGKNSEILKQVDRRTGMTVPEGYFAEFAARMSASLPQKPVFSDSEVKEPRLSRWHRMRPYVYMAAMFAGIWCMMKMFSLFSQNDADLSIENYPGLVTALNNENFKDNFVYPALNDYDILDQLYQSGESLDYLFEDEDFSFDLDVDNQ